uniref:FCP1 homology domain-containing protein n=1 Tax=Leersia perrieri TaxID=77586 RepID=A0A0D9WDS3_9ORYZ
MVSRTPTKSPPPAPALLPRSTTGSPAKKTPSPASSRRRRVIKQRPRVSTTTPVGLKSLAASLDTSLRSCRRRLLKLFSRLALLRSPSKRRAAAAGFRRLRSPSSSPPPPKPSQVAAVPPLPLPPPVDPEKKTLFLDLDETLIHSQTDQPAATAAHDFAVRPVIGGQAITFYVAKRPGVDAFLAAAARLFEVVVFTAGLPEYASLVLDRLDPAGEVFSHRLYRGACRDRAGDGRLVKDLAATGRELGRAVIVDDNPNAYALQPENAVPVAPFIDDAGDRELERVMAILAVAAEFDDCREAIKHYKDLVDAS